MALLLDHDYLRFEFGRRQPGSIFSLHANSILLENCSLSTSTLVGRPKGRLPEIADDRADDFATVYLI
jgi:hypothetical protein